MTRAIVEGIAWRDDDGNAWQRWSVYEQVVVDRDRYRDALEEIERRLVGYVERGEPAAEDAVDILASVRYALRKERP